MPAEPLEPVRTLSFTTGRSYSRFVPPIITRRVDIQISEIVKTKLRRPTHVVVRTKTTNLSTGGHGRGYPGQNTVGGKSATRMIVYGPGYLLVAQSGVVCARGAPRPPLSFEHLVSI